MDRRLVNVPRGSVVVESDMAAFLRDGRLKGVALDVFETKPLPAGSPLWSMPNVLLPSHCFATQAG